MKTKTIIMIAVPIVILAGVGYYFYRRRKKKLPGSAEQIKEGVLYVKK